MGNIRTGNVEMKHEFDAISLSAKHIIVIVLLMQVRSLYNDED